VNAANLLALRAFGVVVLKRKSLKKNLLINMRSLNAQTIRLIDQLRSSAELLGLEICTGSQDQIQLCVPRSNYSVLPAHHRGKTLYAGDVDNCLCWMQGWLASLEYLELLGITPDQIQAKEHEIIQEKEHNRLLYAIRTGRDPTSIV
jgi:hypothetical protein